MPYSGFWRRAFAFIIDLMIVFLPTFFVFGPMVAFQAVVGGGTPQALSTLQVGALGLTVFSWQLITLVLMWLYFALWESGAKQSTWGKRLLGIKVIGADGGRISFGRATARFFSKFISYIILYIGFIMAAFTNRKRTLHDMIAETYVVKRSFEQGQELPETKTRWGWMILICTLWILFLLSFGLFTAHMTLTPTQLAANNAANRLEQLAKEGLGLRTPQREQGVTYFYNEDGYRAVVTDPTSNNKFTIFMQNGSSQACCETFPFGDCKATGFTDCK